MTRPSRRSFLMLPLVAALAGLAPAGQAQAADALVAVAANFADAARAIAKDYGAASGNHITITVGSTGSLQAQIIEGAPFDVMLSADAKTPEELEAVNLVVPGSRFIYAVGKLALWYPKGSKITDPAKLLSDPKITAIAIANPKLAPYGVAARETLGDMGLWEKLKPKIVMGQNIGQTFAMVKSGAASVGFVAASALHGPKAPKGGAIWMPPQESYSEIDQSAGLLIHGKDNPAAKGFLDFLKGPQAAKIKAAYGYGSA